MRFVDVSAAAAMGLLAVAIVVAWSPYPFELNSQQYQRQASLQSYLRGLALDLGVPWLQTADFGQLCGALAGHTNSTLVISALVDGHPCAPRPANALFSANLTVYAGAKQVDLQAWQIAGR